MTADDLIQEANDIFAESRRANLAKVRCAEIVAQHREREVRRADLFMGLVVGSLVVAYGVMHLILWLIR